VKSKNPEKLKVVVDTSVFVAALLSKRGASAEVVALALAGKVHSFHTESTMQELSEVLRRPKFGVDKQVVDHFVRLVMEASFLVAPLSEFSVQKCRDPKDDVFLSLANQTEADYLISLDADLLDLKKLGRTLIVRSAEFLEAFRRT